VQVQVLIFISSVLRVMTQSVYWNMSTWLLHR